MDRGCTICSHNDRHAVDAALLRNESMRSIVDRWSVSRTVLTRHKSEHLTAPAATGSPSEPDNLLDRLKALNSATAAILKDARAGGAKNNELALKAIAHVEKQIEMERGW